jgi:Lon protease-like protein
MDAIPEEMGVMALPGTILFPNALLPLYIFEQRYREMLASALAKDRMFAIGMLSSDEEDEPVFEVGGAGLVRACVQNPDGTSHLVLQGVRRIRFVRWVQKKPYRIARVEPLDSINPSVPETAMLAEMLRKLCDQLNEQGYELPPNFSEYLGNIDSPEALSDAVSSALVPDPLLRQSLLQELDVPARLKGLISCLKERLENG